MAYAIALTDDQLQTELASLPGWGIDDGMLSKTFELENYTAGLTFAVAVGAVAEGLGHHPDMLVTYRKVKVSLVTHDLGSKISDKDVATAKAIEALPYPN